MQEGIVSWTVEAITVFGAIAAAVIAEWLIRRRSANITLLEKMLSVTVSGNQVKWYTGQDFYDDFAHTLASNRDPPLRPFGTVRPQDFEPLYLFFAYDRKAQESSPPIGIVAVDVTLRLCFKNRGYRSGHLWNILVRKGEENSVYQRSSLGTVRFSLNPPEKTPVTLGPDDIHELDLKFALRTCPKDVDQERRLAWSIRTPRFAHLQNRLLKNLGYKCTLSQELYSAIKGKQAITIPLVVTVIERKKKKSKNYNISVMLRPSNALPENRPPSYIDTLISEADKYHQQRIQYFIKRDAAEEYDK
jgi:hypothetical protein